MIGKSSKSKHTAKTHKQMNTQWTHLQIFSKEKFDIVICEY